MGTVLPYRLQFYKLEISNPPTPTVNGRKSPQTKKNRGSQMGKSLDYAPSAMWDGKCNDSKKTNI